MASAVLLLSFILGSIVGSFLNVLVLRYGTGRPIASGRSKCLSCGHELSWFELIPIFSFIFQLGRCLKCGTKISWQYPSVEIITGLAFVGIFYKEFLAGGPNNLFFVGLLLLAWSILIAITAYDLRHKIIPDGLVWLLVTLSMGQMFFEENLSFYDFWAGPIVALPFLAIWLFSGGRAMGLGDGKLALGLGFMLGLAKGVSALLLSFWIGGFVSVYLLLRFRGKFTMKSEVPFAPFLVLGAFLAYFLSLDLAGLSEFLR